MQRINTPNKDPNRFGAGKHGFRLGDPSRGERPTETSPEIWNAVQEELAGAVESSGQNLDGAKYDQLTTAIRIFAGASQKFFRPLAGATAATFGIDFSDANKIPPGILSVDTTTREAVVNLPRASVAWNLPYPLKYRIVKTVDDNLVKVSANSADAILGATGTDLWLAGAGDFVELTAIATSATTGQWFVSDRSNQTPIGQIQFMARDSAPPGWINLNESWIGPAGTGWTLTSNTNGYTGAQYRALFMTLFSRGLVSLYGSGYELYVGSSNSSYTNRGHSSAADWWSAGNAVLPLPKIAGRVLAAAGSGSGLTNRSRGEITGEETHTLTSDEQATMRIALRGWMNLNAGKKFLAASSNNGTVSGFDQSAIDTINQAIAVGGGESHNNMQPTAFENAYIRYLE